MKSIKYHNKAIFYLIAANIIWGAASPIFKLTLQNLPPFTLAFCRFFGAFLLLLPFTIKKLHLDKEDWSKMILLSLFGVTINITFFFYGLRLAPSVNAPIIASSGPVFLYLFSILILKEKRQAKVLLGTIISLLGVLIIVGFPLIEQSINHLFGNIFYIFATLGAVGHTIFSKEIIAKYKPETVTLWSFLIGSVSFIPFFLYEMVRFQPFTKIDNRGWLGLAFGIFLCSFVGYYLFEWSVKRMQAQEIGVFTYIDPIVAAALAIPLLGEVITPVFIIGSIFVFGGIYIAENRLHYHPLHKLKTH